MNKTRRNILIGVLTAILLLSVGVGVTYAFLTDSATSSQNVVQSGRMGIDLKMLGEGTDEWSLVNGEGTPIFNYGAGALAQTDVKILRVENRGDLALKWEARIVCDGELSNLAKVIDVYVKTADASFAYPTDKENLDAEWKLVGTLDNFIHNIPAFISGDVLKQESDYFGIALRIKDDASDEYQSLALGAFDITIHTLQQSYEEDFFDNQYDAGLTFPCNHMTIETIAGYPATCTTDGLEDGKRCVTCEVVLLERKTIPSPGHTVVTDDAVEPDCVNTGLTEGSHCSVCNEVFVAQTIVDALGHTAGAEATCTAPQTCTECSAVLTAIKDHTPSDWVVVAVATYTQEGLQQKKCTVCSTVLEEEAFPKLSPFTFSDNGDGTYTVTGFKSDVNVADFADLVIPSTYEGKPVTAIGANAFQGCTDLTGVTIPNTVKSMGEKAFSRCSGIKEVIFEEGCQLNALSKRAFEFCTSLANITIPNSVTSIDIAVFDSCIALTSIIIPDSVTEFKTAVFRDCTNLASVKLSKFTTTVGTYVFLNCTSLTNIQLPESVQSISMYAFMGCTNLTSVEIPESVTSIVAYAFYYCEKLERITFGGTIEQWNAIAKENGWNSQAPIRHIDCANETTIHLYTTADAAKAATCTTTGLTAGSHCTYCGEVVKPQTVVDKLPHTEGEPVVEGETWYDSTDKKAYGEGVIYCTVCGTELRRLTVEVEIINTAITASNRASAGYTGVENENLVIPEVFKHDGTWYRVTAIGDKAFRDLWNITTVNIPAGVTSIGDYAFYNTSLISVTFDENSQLESIGENAFATSMTLASITIPANVTSIGASAFSGCMDISSITIPANVTSIGASAFSGCTVLSSITFEGTVEQWEAIDKDADWNTDVPAQYVQCSNGKICLGDHVEKTEWTIVKEATFTETGLQRKECENCNYILTEEIIPVKSSYSYAINDSGESNSTVTLTKWDVNSPIANVVIPDYIDGKPVTAIADQAFVGAGLVTNDAITSITLPDTLVTIGNMALAGLLIEEITIPDSVTTIYGGALYYCTELKRVTLPVNITIADQVFKTCTSLVEIHYAGTMEQWKTKSATFGGAWDYNTGNYIVYCSDGNLDKTGNPV